MTFKAQLVFGFFQQHLKAIFASLFAIIVLAGIILGFSFVNQNPMININGSTTVLPVLENLGWTYWQKFHIKIAVNAGASTTGIHYATTNLTNVGMSSRFPNTSEYQTAAWQEMTTIPLAYDGIVFGINPTGLTFQNKNYVLTPQAIANIYSGVDQYWDQVPDLGCLTHQRINLISREYGSGTRDAFYQALTNYQVGIDQASLPDYAYIATSNGALTTILNNIGGTIGYFSVGYMQNLDPKIKIASLKTSNGTIYPFTTMSINEIKWQIFSQGVNRVNDVNAYNFWHNMILVINTDQLLFNPTILNFLTWIFDENDPSHPNAIAVDHMGYIPLSGYKSPTPPSTDPTVNIDPTMFFYLNSHWMTQTEFLQQMIVYPDSNWQQKFPARFNINRIDWWNP